MVNVSNLILGCKLLTLYRALSIDFGHDMISPSGGSSLIPDMQQQKFSSAAER
jgi:hypothetical protein